MANNRLRMLGIDNSGSARIAFTFARHFNGAWRCYDDDVLPIGECMNDFFDECFEKGYGIALADDYNDKPLTVVWNYNDNGTDLYEFYLKKFAESYENGTEGSKQ